MPRQRRTLDPYRKSRDSREHRELPQLPTAFGLLRRLAGDHVVEALEQLVDLASGLPLHRRCHERSGGLRDRAARPLEADVADSIAVQFEPNRELIPAQRIAALGVAVGVLHAM